MYLDYYASIQQILSGLVVGVVYWPIGGVGSNPTVIRLEFFFFQFEETCTYMNISSLKYHLIKCDIKAENSSTLCKFRKGRKWLQPMGSNPDRFSRLVRQKRETERKTLLAGCIRRRSHSQGRGTFKAERYLHFFRYTRDRAIDIPLFSQGPVSGKAVLCLPCLHSRSKFQLF